MASKLPWVHGGCHLWCVHVIWAQLLLQKASTCRAFAGASDTGGTTDAVTAPPGSGTAGDRGTATAGPGKWIRAAPMHVGGGGEHTCEAVRVWMSGGRLLAGSQR